MGSLNLAGLRVIASLLVIPCIAHGLSEATKPENILLPRDGRGLQYDAAGARTHLKGFHSLDGPFPDASHQILDHLTHLRNLNDAKASNDSSIHKPGHPAHEDEEEVKPPQFTSHGAVDHSGVGLLGRAAQSLSYSGGASLDSYRQRLLEEHRLDDARKSHSWVGLADDQDPGKQASLPLPVRAPPSAPVHVGVVFVLTMLMAGCSGLGALPYLFTGSLSKEWSGLANAVACGVMLAASFDLVHEGEPHGAGLVVLGVVLGGAFIQAMQQWLSQVEHVKFEGLQGAGARKTLLMVCIMAAHALGEGSGVGVSFCGQRGWAQGVLVTLAIGLHNIPEGLATSTVLMAKGVSMRQAVLWTLFTALPQPLVAVPAYLFVDSFRSLLPVALGFAAGCMVWMVFAELMPDALADAQHAQVATAATLSAAWLEGLRMMLAKLERPDGSLAPPVAVDLREVAPKCLLLLLPALAATLASGATTVLHTPTGPLALGAAAGVLIWIGGAEAVIQILNPQTHLVPTVFAILAGSGLVVLVWRAYTGTPQVAAGKKRDESAGDLEAQMRPLEVSGGPPATSGGHASAPAGWEMVGNGQQSDSDEGGRSMYGGRRPLPRRPVAASALPKALASQESGEPLPLSSTALYTQCSVPVATASSKTFTSYQSAGLGSTHQAQVAVLGLFVLTAQGIPEGWLLGSLADGGTESALRLLLPACLRAFLKGVVAVYLARPLFSQSTWYRVGIAASVASIAPLVACTCVLAINPLVEPAIALHQGLTLAWRGVAVMAGAALTAGLWKMYPTAQALHKRSAQRGVAVGMLGGAAVYLTLGALCAFTPFCLAISMR